MAIKRHLVLEKFEFAEEPSFTPRTPYYWMSEEELVVIKRYPYILDERCPFTAIFKVVLKEGKDVVGEEHITLHGTVPKGFSYNLADIPFFVQPFTYDKHSPFVKNASFIHDYLLSHKRDLYEFWELKEKGVTPSEFREMTSLIFCHVLKHNAVSWGKAQVMTFFVNLFQAFLPSWHNIDKTETEL